MRRTLGHSCKKRESRQKYFKAVPVRILICFCLLVVGVSADASVSKESAGNSKAKVVKTAGDPLTMRKLRRVAVGASAAGKAGLFGAALELGFQPDFAVQLGFGGGPGYQTFNFEAKRLLGASILTPYMAAGYARWSRSGDTPVTKTTPGYLADNLLTEDQKARGHFVKNIIYPSLGLQYLELSGPLVGSSLYVEALILMDIEEMLLVPTGGLGYLYYF